MWYAYMDPSNHTSAGQHPIPYGPTSPKTYQQKLVLHFMERFCMTMPGMRSLTRPFQISPFRLLDVFRSSSMPGRGGKKQWALCIRGEEMT